MKLQSVFVVSMLVGGVAFVSSPARADGICISLDGSCSSSHNPACTTNAQCAVSGLVSGLTTCDTVAGHCVAKCGQGLISGVLTTLSCGGDKPVCYSGNSALTGLCGCTLDTDCSGGKTCNTTLHQCVTPVVVPPVVLPPITIPVGDGGVTLFGDAGTTIPLPDGGSVTLPIQLPGVDAGSEDPVTPTIPSAPGSSSGTTTPTGDDGTGGGAGSTPSGSAGGSASATTSASASVGDAGAELDANAAVAADGGCNAGGHGSGATFLGVLGAAFAFVAARRRRSAK